MSQIQKLPEEVINRIAAGEVVQRPSAALKELLENAIDAGASRIQVLAAEGGLDVLQVSDDGSGVRRGDLPLLCERYATSKLRTFDDLHHVHSFGFRGEALASISYVSRVTVTTRCRSPASAPASAETAAPEQPGESNVAWRCLYANGALVGDPQMCAGNPGTTIRAERLFYNTLVRRNALRASEEWSRILDTVTRYAFAFPHIGFSCQKEGGNASGGVHFPSGSTTLHNLRIAHGSKLASHLRLVYAYQLGNVKIEEREGKGEAAKEVTCVVKKEEETELFTSASELSVAEEAEPVHHKRDRREAELLSLMERRAAQVSSTTGPYGDGLFTLAGYTSDPILANRKASLCLFINHRLVESAAIRKAIDAVYSSVLTGGNRPFTVLFISVPTDRVDVNVHPTKKEVFLLDEELILARVSEVCRAAVLEAAAARQLDMLKMQHTAAAALKALSSSTTGVETQDEDHRCGSGSSSQTVLRGLQEQFQRGQPLASPLTSSTLTPGSAPLRRSSAAGGGAGPNAGGPGGAAVVVAPCTVVRVEAQRGALDRFFLQKSQPVDSVMSLRADEAEEDCYSAAERHSAGRRKATLLTECESPGVCGGCSQPATSLTEVLASVRRAAKQDSPEQQQRTIPTVVTTAESPDSVMVEESADLSATLRLTKRSREESIKESDTEEEEEGSEEDVMQEFKQYRRQLHDHVEAAKDIPATAEEKNPEDVATAPSAVVHTENSLNAFSQLQETHLGAVVRVADLLRDKEDAERHVYYDLEEKGDSLPPTNAADLSSLVDLPEVQVSVLSSVTIIMDEIRQAASPTADSFISQLAYVGVLDNYAFLGQAGTTLLLLDTMTLVREAVFQRIFLRWGQQELPLPPVLMFESPLPLQELLLSALWSDTSGMQPPSLALLELLRSCGGEGRAEELQIPLESSSVVAPTTAAKLLFHPLTLDSPPSAMPPPRSATLRYVRRLIRRLCRWRDLLRDYFSIHLSVDGDVMGLPYGLNRHWPPLLRAVPLTMWLLAEAVPYPSWTGQQPSKERLDERPSNGVDSATASEGASPEKAAVTSLELRSGSSGSVALYSLESEADGIAHEVQCFSSIARHLSDTLYGLLPPCTKANGEGEAAGASPEAPASFGSPTKGEREPQRLSMEELVQYGLLPCLKNTQLFRLPDRCLRDGTVRSMVSVESLYKVFERC